MAQKAAAGSQGYAGSLSDRKTAGTEVPAVHVGPS